MKKVLLIAGGGTLGRYTAKELLRKGYKVGIVCHADEMSSEENLRYFKAHVDIDYLKNLFSQTHYDGIVNFIP